MKSPAFQFYATDFLAGRVATYSLEEVGAYSLLLAFDWSLNGLPNDIEKLAKLCRINARKFRALWANIAEQFEEEGGKLYNHRLRKERQKQELWREKSAKGGRAKAKGGTKGGTRVVEPPHMPKGCTPSPTPTPVTTTATDIRPAAADSALFDAAWSVYPKRAGGNSRPEALRSWKARIAGGVPAEVLLAGVERYAAFCVATERVGTEYVKTGKTFFGPGNHYLETWDLPKAKPTTKLVSDGQGWYTEVAA